MSSTWVWLSESQVGSSCRNPRFEKKEMWSAGCQSWLYSTYFRIKILFLLILSFEMTDHPHMLLPNWISSLFLPFLVNLSHLTSCFIELCLFMHALWKSLQKLNFLTCSNLPKYFLSHMAILPYVLYIKKNLFISTFSTPNMSLISQAVPEKSGVSKLLWTLGHPVVHTCNLQ